MACMPNTETKELDLEVTRLKRELKEALSKFDTQKAYYEHRFDEMYNFICKNHSVELKEYFHLLKDNGELDALISEALSEGLSEVQTKTDDMVNAKLFGAVGDGEHDDTNALQDAIDYALEHGKVVYIPEGKYRTTRALKLYEYQKLVGAERTLTSIERTGSYKESGKPFSAAIMLVRTEGFRYNYTEGQTIKDIALNCDPAIDYGIIAETEVAYLTLDHMYINEALTSICLQKGAWVSSIKDVNIWKCNRGFLFQNTGTSTTLENVYVIEAKECAYEVWGLTYSEWKNVCCDWCEGTAYRFEFCNMTVNGMGCESLQAKTGIQVNNSNLLITSAHIFALEKEEATYIIGNGSNMILENSKIGTNGTSRAKFCDAGSSFNLALRNVDTSKIDAESSSWAYYNITRFADGDSDYFTSLGERFAYIGAYNRRSGSPETLGYDIPMVGIYSNIITHPYYGQGVAGNREWNNIKNRGDIFVNNAPGNGVAFFQQITDSAYHHSDGVITAINGNVITVSSMNFGVMSDKGDIKIQVGGKILDQKKEHWLDVVSVNEGANTITLSDASKLHVGEHFYYRNNVTYMRDAQYKAVQHVLSGNASGRPKNPVQGMCYFDTALGRPIWWTGSAWVNASGVTV